MNIYLEKDKRGRYPRYFTCPYCHKVMHVGNYQFPVRLCCMGGYDKLHITANFLESDGIKFQNSFAVDYASPLSILAGRFKDMENEIKCKDCVHSKGSFSPTYVFCTVLKELVKRDKARRDCSSASG